MSKLVARAVADLKHAGTTLMKYGPAGPLDVTRFASGVLVLVCLPG